MNEFAQVLRETMDRLSPGWRFRSSSERSRVASDATKALRREISGQMDWAQFRAGVAATHARLIG